MTLTKNISPHAHPTFQDEVQKKETSKPWRKFLAKLQQHSTVPVEQWDHYQLLGYVISRTNIAMQYEGTEPRLHPQMMKMRKLIAMLYDCCVLPAHWSAGTYQTHRYHPQAVKNFLDWALAILEHKRIQLTSLGYLLHQVETPEGVIVSTTWVDAYRKEMAHV